MYIIPIVPGLMRNEIYLIRLDHNLDDKQQLMQIILKTLLKLKNQNLSEDTTMSWKKIFQWNVQLIKKSYPLLLVE